MSTWVPTLLSEGRPIPQPTWEMPEPLIPDLRGISPVCRQHPPYLSWLHPLAGPPSEEPLWEQEEQEDLRVLGCHMDGRPLPCVSIRSWGTAKEWGESRH